jgi:1-aminocyclopropane-1-carboxylate deaminase/D-cysteine desulfhydrase-like pyridoxal-dependent ACC family enzyme
VTELPLWRRFPALRVPRVALGSFPTRVDRVSLTVDRTLLIKRDDLSADPIGGNKVRGLEFLLASVRAGDRVLTVGSRGSTHALATATYAARLGARTRVVRWDQEMNPAARVVDDRLRDVADVRDARNVIAAYVLALAMRPRARHWIPAGGAAPIAVLGHVNAGLELSEQIARGECPRPDCVVVPCGTGGTSAGIALGLRIAELNVPVIAVRVVPRIVGSRRRIRSLANRAARLIEHAASVVVPRLRPGDVSFDDDFYGGAYGRPIGAGLHDDVLRSHGITLDDTYSRKAFAAVVARRDARVLLWLTFDGRILSDSNRRAALD